MSLTQAQVEVVVKMIGGPSATEPGPGVHDAEPGARGPRRTITRSSPLHEPNFGETPDRREFPRNPGESR
jgi:hypothetical protein